MKYSRLTSKDVQDILAVEEASQLFPWSAQKIADCLARPNAVCWAAKQQGVLNGYVLGGFVLDEAEIWNFSVLPQVRRQGVGYALLTRFLDFLKTQSIKRVFLEVRASNQPAILCYQKAGFGPVGLRKNYYETDTGREDAIVMCYRSYI